MEMNDLTFDALNSAEAHLLATELHQALIESAEALTPGGLIARACHIASTEGVTVLDFLAEELDHVRRATEESKGWSRLAKNLFAESNAERAIALRGIPYNYFQRQVALERLQARISRAPKARAEAAEKYRNAGLSQEQIAAVGIEPSEATEATWREEAAQIEHEIASLKAFMVTPFDKTLLEGVELTPLPAYPEAPRGELPCPADFL